MSTSFAGNPAHWCDAGRTLIAKWSGRQDGGKLDLLTGAAGFAEHHASHEQQQLGMIK